MKGNKGEIGGPEPRNEAEKTTISKVKNRESDQETKRAVRKSDEPDVQALTRAFRSREKEIQGCVQRHAVELQGKPKVSVLFRIQPSGTVDSAEISPGALAQTALGSCVLSVARSTRFPSQKEQISFYIPVTVWRLSGK
jgi:hypothetical protein